MRLSVDCTWNDKKERAKVVITFQNAPKTLFHHMKVADIARLKFLQSNCLLEGPQVLQEFERYTEKYPKSIYALYAHYQCLRSFELFEDAHDLFLQMKEKFPDQVFTQCIEAHRSLEKKSFDDFFECEVLKGVFPRRKVFYYQEALLFHHVWRMYYQMKKKPSKSTSHDKFFALIEGMLFQFSN